MSFARSAGLWSRGRLSAVSHGQVIVAVVLLGTLVRLLYGLAVNDPMSGPDADTYSSSAAALAHHGLFSDVHNLVARHSGYPVALALSYDVFGVNPRIAVAAQAALVGAAIYCVVRLTQRELGETTALATAVLLSTSPAVLASSTELMYEPAVLVALGAGLDLASRAMHAAPGRRFAALASGSALALGVAITFHPKVIAVALPLLVWVALVRRRRPLILALAILVLCVPPLALAGRDAIATGHPQVASHLGIDMFSFRSKNAVDAKPADVGGSKPTLQLFGEKALAFWGPMAAPAALGHGGTWFHQLSVERVVPSSLRASRAVSGMVRGLEYAVDVASALLALGGLALLLLSRPRRWDAIALFGLPVGVFLAVALVTIAEPRFRLPAAVAYVPLQGLAVTAIASRLRRDARRSLPTMVSA